ncbi:GNAT family N-acetyltransferase [Phyllobacterium phragmitis]|uniref:GNAT family N-acetyltransferase n=1 Tax=Phyllobacterium phragmitis TaxID=2670329 RepID=A0A2S9IJB5_9HYPH|nr:GNAT family N-acetyltransferase [Phyllobacterium phragmitis]PRD40633.1 GNAT family N-acetyltransferase [Phyllobacterium phragmitis]
MATNKREISIRRLSMDEIDAFRCIRLEALSREPTSFASRFEDWADLPDEEWRQRLNNPVFVAFLNGQPVGMMGLSRHRPSKMAHRAALIGVYVHKSQRGTGIAENLLNKVADYARSIGVLQLELAVSAENPAALCFYRRHGFVEIGRIPCGFLHNDKKIDEVTMVRRLNG